MYVCNCLSDKSGSEAALLEIGALQRFLWSRPNNSLLWLAVFFLSHCSGSVIDGAADQQCSSQSTKIGQSSIQRVCVLMLRANKIVPICCTVKKKLFHNHNVIDSKHSQFLSILFNLKSFRNSFRLKKWFIDNVKKIAETSFIRTQYIKYIYIFWLCLFIYMVVLCLY